MWENYRLYQVTFSFLFLKRSLILNKMTVKIRRKKKPKKNHVTGGEAAVCAASLIWIEPAA